MVGMMVGLALVALLGAPQGQQTAGAAQSCRRVAADHLRWVHNGDWDGQRLILGDVGTGSLAVFDLTSSQWTQVAYPGEGPLEFTSHEVIPTSVPGTLISAEGRLVRLDEALRPKEGYSLAYEGKTKLVSLIAGVETAPGRALGLVFHEFSGPPEPGSEPPRARPWSGVGWLVFTPTTRVERVKDFAEGRTERDAYAAYAAKLAAVIGAKAYWLALETEAYLLELTPGGEATPGTSRRLDLVPEAWRKVPAFSRRGGAENLRADRELMAKLSFLTGLAAQGSELFLLYRTAKLPGASWRLAAIDPAKPAAVRYLSLPTRSVWTTVIPGPDYWAILEQGPMLGPGAQVTQSLLLVPSAWFSSADSPLTRPGAEDACSR